ncbi:MAG: 6,7-dimethyl-8-ribityllumazine synthase [Acidobacteria bacterium]|nr:6,7-dimethyl-8-ribityllumazine synthase [Acidobacteriota bacterium]
MTPASAEPPKYRELQGELTAAGLRFAIVVSRFNAFITERLLHGAVDALTRAGAKAADVDVVRVPGALEIPLAAQKLAETERYDAIVCLGAVIRGETPHFEYVCAESSRGVAKSSLRTGVPMSYGILTVENLEQAVDRAGLKSGNKGFEAAMSAVEMANLIGQIAKPAPAAPGKRPRR